MEKILKIEERNFKTPERDWGEYEGYEIITAKQTIKVGISAGQCCCENYGYFITNDNINDFIGANLRNIKIVDNCLDVKKLEELGDHDSGGCMFVNLETSRGLLQFVAYNQHNGYYGHEAVCVSSQLNHSETL